MLYIVILYNIIKVENYQNKNTNQQNAMKKVRKRMMSGQPEPSAVLTEENPSVKCSTDEVAKISIWYTSIISTHTFER